MWKMTNYMWRLHTYPPKCAATSQLYWERIKRTEIKILLCLLNILKTVRKYLSTFFHHAVVENCFLKALKNKSVWISRTVVCANKKEIHILFCIGGQMSIWVKTDSDFSASPDFWVISCLVHLYLQHLIQMPKCFQSCTATALPCLMWLMSVDETGLSCCNQGFFSLSKVKQNYFVLIKGMLRKWLTAVLLCWKVVRGIVKEKKM